MQQAVLLRCRQFSQRVKTLYLRVYQFVQKFGFLYHIRHKVAVAHRSVCLHAFQSGIAFAVRDRVCLHHHAVKIIITLSNFVHNLQCHIQAIVYAVYLLTQTLVFLSQHFLLGQVYPIVEAKAYQQCHSGKFKHRLGYIPHLVPP